MTPTVVTSLILQAAGKLHLFCDLVMVLLHAPACGGILPALPRESMAVNVFPEKLERFFHRSDARARARLTLTARCGADGTW